MAPLEHVVVEDPERMNLLGLMLAHLMEKNLAQGPSLLRQWPRTCRVGIEAGGMRVSLVIRGDRVTVSRGFSEDLEARVVGTMDGFLAFGVRRSIASPMLRGDLKASGNPLALLPLLWLTAV